MGYTITEKILMRSSGKNDIAPGDIIWSTIDTIFTHEIIGPRVFANSLKELGDKIMHKDRFIIFVDHYNLPATIRQAEIVKLTRDWSKKHNIKLFYNFCGPEHQILAEDGFIRPGTVVLGTDSHTVTGGAFGAFASGIGSTDCAFSLATGNIWLRVPESIKFNWHGDLPYGVMAKDLILYNINEIGHSGATYKACEFVGSTIKSLGVDERMTICNMTVEMGAKNGIINPDEKTLEYMKEHTTKPFSPLFSDVDAEYEAEFIYEADNLEPLVACPPDVDNVRSVSEIEGIKIDSVLIGTCTGGKYEDMVAAAKILKGKKVYEGVSVIIIPASIKIFKKMIKANLMDVFIESGCIVTHPTCGPCAGHTGGLMTAGEVRISTQNRNFKGRSGSPDSDIYLASPLTCAASAITGKITDPRDYM